ncbi:retinol dehydrogenase 14-like [Galleria mellonella]|uniref:Retinol dehydrogenase 14-like n=1 Tax=Galleria mellonella TaxID=7137 RepID=A0ABM3MF81_GALME|nr:retinol dehydrogenase 14-like [Galleria mellonella]
MPSKSKGVCYCTKHIFGKVVIVTGGNSGIGYETAKDLAYRGGRIIIACKNEEHGIAARDKIIAETGNRNVHFRKLNLASLKSVRQFAEDILKNKKRIDILINNAGIYSSKNVKTEDGLLEGMQVNHFGPFLLTCLLLPILKMSAPSRIINVSSVVYKKGKIDFNNLNMEKETESSFKGYQVYYNSKLCNILMITELSRRLEGTGVTANSLHPGIVNTNIFKGVDDRFTKIVISMFKCHFKTPWEGAQTTIYLAVSPEVASVSGKYFVDCHQEVSSKTSRDPELARKLWEVSEKLVCLNKLMNDNIQTKSKCKVNTEKLIV